MEITDLAIDGYERVVRAKDPASGLHALISVHDTTLGPGCGGLRMWPYPSEKEALSDVLRLSRAMTYKSAVAHTGLGGGKAVIIGDPAVVKSEALYLAMGQFIDSLEGTYIVAEDVNTTLGDLEIVRRATQFVTGLLQADGGSGNPSPYTAYGVYLGIRAGLARVYGSDDLAGRSVAIQGVGAVGGPLARRLVEAGATVYAADQRQERVEALFDEIDLRRLQTDELFEREVDVLAPCALGAVINDETLPKLRCKIIAGAANNQLQDPRHGDQLKEKGILFAPDYVINAGGIINVSIELRQEGYNEQVSLTSIDRISQALQELWDIADEQHISPSQAAEQLAKRILAEGASQTA
jgi:leucine dehydrogenase